MIQKIKLAILSLSWLFVTTVPMALAGGTAAAVDFDVRGHACQGSGGEFRGANIAPCQQADTGLRQFVTNVINIASIIVGIVAVIMIIVGGFRYVSSGGKEESVRAAKTTILYALIGLVIVALAQLIVRFVINKASSTSATA